MSPAAGVVLDVAPRLGEPLAAALMSGAYLALFALAEALRWLKRLPAGGTRALAHVGGGLLALLLPHLFASATLVLVVVVGFVLLLAVAERRGLLRAVHNAPERRAGVYLFPVAIAAVFLLARHDAAAYATAVLALTGGDAAAGLVGRRYGRHHFAVPFGDGQRKTLEGSAALLTIVSVTTLCCLAGAGTGLPSAALAALCVAAVCALVEAASPWGTDNLSLPIAAVVSVATLRTVGLIGPVAAGALHGA